MNYQILYKDAFPILDVKLMHNESIKAESDAMVSMSSTIDIAGKLEGGLFSGLGRMLAGEKFFFQTLHASRGPGSAMLAPVVPGSIVAIELDGNCQYNLQKDGFLASTEGIQIETKMQNIAKGFFSKEGFFILKVHGKGIVFINSYGSIHTIDLAPGEDIIIDNGHLVAWQKDMHYKLEKASSKGWISSFTSGEGIVCRIFGPGKIFIQTRNPKGFAAWMKNLMMLT
jgi:uncharacterized protein (TIGR00266 family)